MAKLSQRHRYRILPPADGGLGIAGFPGLGTWTVSQPATASRCQYESRCTSGDDVRKIQCLRVEGSIPKRRQIGGLQRWYRSEEHGEDGRRTSTLWSPRNGATYIKSLTRTRSSRGSDEGAPLGDAECGTR